MARRRILDTSVLIYHWRSRAEAPLDRWSDNDARTWAEELIEFRGSDCIVTPVAIEFSAGATNRHESRLYRAYLEKFRIVDEGRVPKDDWIVAKRLAERIPRSGKPRQLGDCLIKAIATRLHYDVDTLDEGMP
jgi:predicted nucleic acid-binding protein